MAGPVPPNQMAPCVVSAVEGSFLDLNQPSLTIISLLFLQPMLTCYADLPSSYHTRPSCSLWGEGRNGRLAIERDDPRVNLLTRSGSLPIPARLPMKVPIVDLVAGGWSFHALSVHGKVYHWGQLDGGSFAPYRPASTSAIPLVAYPGAMVPPVTELAAQIPPIKRMLSGRLHVLALDDHNRLWTWANWAEAGLVSSSWLDYATHRVMDIAAGWTYSAVLLEDRKTKHRTVHAWWQRFLSPTLLRSTRRHTTAQNQNLAGEPEAIPDHHGCFNFDPLQSLKVPELPKLNDDEYIEKLAAGECFLIALSNKGKVYKLDLSPPQMPLWGGAAPVQGHLQDLLPPQDQEDEEDLEDGRMQNRAFAELERQILTGMRTWQYMKKFSESRYWTSHHNSHVPTSQTDTSNKKDAQDRRDIRFISANFRTFFCIGAGAVLQGQHDATEETEPTLKEELQNRGVIRWALDEPLM